MWCARSGSRAASSSARARSSSASSSTWPPWTSRTTKTSRTEPWTSPERTDASTRWTPAALSAAESEANRPGRSGPSMVSVVDASSAALSASTWNAWRSVAPPSSKRRALRSAVWRVSTTSRLRRPMEQPRMTPASAPSSPTRRVAGSARCAAVKRGGARPSRLARPSSAPPKTTPAESLQIWPQAAAESVERPKVTPRVQSIKLPACIMMVLSIRPKPTIGTAQTKKCRDSSLRKGASAAAVDVAAPAQPR
mmetsp:Transcript_36097/g.111701  ORF Transcript_36097/g.111701 Transcript_36097/m.111701 type:complete len:252 (-) Transcript_36097:158-913(-)